MPDSHDQPTTAPGGRGRSARSLAVPVIALVAVFALAIAAFAGGTDDDAPQPQAGDADTSQAAEAVEDDDLAEALAALERREGHDPLAVGDVDAPVLMIEWADYQCPYCARFAREVKPELLDRYVDEGVLRIEWRDFAVLGEESTTAALGARAAGEQGAYWEFHDEVFAEDRERNAGELAEDRLIAMADDLGLDAEQFARDLDDPAHAEAAATDRELGQQLGITGTPAFLVNGRPIMGFQPTDVFVDTIEEAAAEADA